MIEFIRDLEPDQQRELIGLLDPLCPVQGLGDTELQESLIGVLRGSLDVPENGDLPEYLRRRLVEVSLGHFELFETADRLTDFELAEALADFALSAAAQLPTNADLRADFDTFTRTKSRREQERWRDDIKRANDLLEASRVGRSAKSKSDQERNRIATAVLADLSSIALRTQQPASSKRPPSKAAVASGMAGGAAAGSAFAALTGATATAAMGSVVALPLGAIAGGLYMAGRGRKSLERVATDDRLHRTRRARRSKLVQNVVVISVYLVASAT